MLNTIFFAALALAALNAVAVVVIARLGARLSGTAGAPRDACEIDRAGQENEAA